MSVWCAERHERVSSRNRAAPEVRRENPALFVEPSRRPLVAIHSRLPGGGIHGGMLVHHHRAHTRSWRPGQFAVCDCQFAICNAPSSSPPRLPKRCAPVITPAFARCALRPFELTKATTKLHRRSPIKENPRSTHKKNGNSNPPPPSFTSPPLQRAHRAFASSNASCTI